jgi:hypothetical protein
VRPWNSLKIDLAGNTWVYARVSPSEKECILTGLKTLGCITPEDLEKITERRKLCMKASWKSLLGLPSRHCLFRPLIPQSLPWFRCTLPPIVSGVRKVVINLQKLFVSFQSILTHPRADGTFLLSQYWLSCLIVISRNRTQPILLRRCWYIRRHAYILSDDWFRFLDVTRSWGKAGYYI